MTGRSASEPRCQGQYAKSTGKHSTKWKFKLCLYLPFFFFNLENSIRKLPIHMSGMVSLYVENYILHLKQVRTLNDLK